MFKTCRVIQLVQKMIERLFDNRYIERNTFLDKKYRFLLEILSLLEQVFFIDMHHMTFFRCIDVQLRIFLLTLYRKNGSVSKKRTYKKTFFLVH
jgi:hypothetical protein